MEIHVIITACLMPVGIHMLPAMSQQRKAQIGCDWWHWGWPCQGNSTEQCGEVCVPGRTLHCTEHS